MKKALQVLLHILGFPLLIALVVLVDLPIIKGGISYGVFLFVGIIVVAVMAIIYYIAFICLVAKKKNKKSITRQTMTLIIVVFCCLTVFWGIVDLALPDFFANATSKTIFYEDLVDNYEARGDVNKALLDEYIRRNYNNGNLPDENNGGMTLAEYQAEGVRNELVSKLLAIHFTSIDQDGYTTFVSPYIDMANDGRLTTSTLIHLLLDERTFKDMPYYLYDASLDEIIEDPVMWNILDMLGSDMAMDLGMDETTMTLIKVVLNMVNSPLADVIEEVLGSPIYISVNGTSIVLTPSNESRGVLDYQSQAWLNSNGLLYAIVTLISVRNLFLIFSGWIILLNFLIGLLRGMNKEIAAKKSGAVQAAEEANQKENYGGYPNVVQSDSYLETEMKQIRKTLADGTRARLRHYRIQE